jgi:hypothetical protein
VKMGDSGGRVWGSLLTVVSTCSGSRLDSRDVWRSREDEDCRYSPSGRGSLGDWTISGRIDEARRSRVCWVTVVDSSGRWKPS